MSWWTRLMHPWWRPVGIAIGLLGMLVVTGSFVFGYSNKWFLPFQIAFFAIAVLQFRQMMRDALAAENRERSRPTDLTPGDPRE